MSGLPQQGNQDQRMVQSPFKIGSCFACGMPGHFARDCPSRVSSHWAQGQQQPYFPRFGGPALVPPPPAFAPNNPAVTSAAGPQPLTEQSGNSQETENSEGQGAAQEENGQNRTNLINLFTTDIIRRQRPRYDGIYVKTVVHGIKFLFTADTGATRTIISTKIFNKIPEYVRPKLKESGGR